MFWRLILVYIDQSYSLLVIDLQCQVPQNLLVLILMASEAVVESSENVSDVWRRVACVAGAWKKWAQDTKGVSLRVSLARPFSLSPATSKRLLRRLGAGLPCKAQRFVACDKALRGALVADQEKEGARRLWFLINGDSVSSHAHGFSNSLIIHIENTKEINV